MTDNQYQLGQLVTVKVIFRDRDAAEFDPSPVFLSVRGPDDVTVTYTFEDEDSEVEITNPTEGNYQADILPTEAGLWYYRWWTDGETPAAEENRIEVLEASAI